MTRDIPFRNTLGARLGLLSVAILVSAILLIAADFRMLGEIDAAMARTNTLGHDRGDAYQLLALTERLARDSGEERVRTLAELADVRERIDRRFENVRGDDLHARGPMLVGPAAAARRETFWRSQIVPALDRLAASHDPATLSVLTATVKRYVTEMDDIQKEIDAGVRVDADQFRTI